MPKGLLGLNVVLVAASLLLVGYIIREASAPPPAPAPSRARPATAATAATGERPPAASAASYSVVTTRNLFSPTRSEAPPSTAGAPNLITAPVAALPKPFLHGVVLRDSTPIAYLEDPGTKRISGYRLGDAVAGGTVQAINADRVTLTRPDGLIDIRLRDPARPRPAVPQQQPPGGPGQPSQPAAPPAPGAQAPLPAPGTAMQPGPPVTPPAQPSPTQPFLPPGVQAPATGEGIAPPPRRALPPNLLRRLPPATTDAPAP